MIQGGTETGRSVAGRVVLITGASSGVGAATARAVVRQGGKVVLAARRTAPLEAVVEDCGGVDCALAVPADLTREADVQRTIELVLAHHGRLDAVVLNAAVGLVGRIEAFSTEAWEQTFATNVTSVFFLSRAAIPHLRASRGTIIAIGSEFSRAGFPGLGAYAASKWALLGLMQSLALELRPDGIKVSSILPGGILTDFGPDTRVQKLERQARGEKFLQPEDVAEAVCFLLVQPERAWTQELTLWPG